MPNLNPQRGAIAMFLLLGVVLLGAVMFTRGIFPSFEKSQSGQGSVKIKDEQNFPRRKETLQLSALEFDKCSEVAAVDMLLDRSGSMGSRAPDGKTKISKLKEAVLDFTGKLNDNSVIGIQSFSSSSITNNVEVSFYRDVKDQIRQEVNGLSPSGQTPTNRALRFSYDRLREAVPKYPDRKFAFIFVSDGQPVPDSQDPRLPQNAPNPAEEIKNLGVDVFSIGILDSRQIRAGTMKRLLEDIASSPDKAYIAPDGEQLKEIYSNISSQICI